MNTINFNQSTKVGVINNYVKNEKNINVTFIDNPTKIEKERFKIAVFWDYDSIKSSKFDLIKILSKYDYLTFVGSFSDQPSDDIAYIYVGKITDRIKMINQSEYSIEIFCDMVTNLDTTLIKSIKNEYDRSKGGKMYKHGISNYSYKLHETSIPTISKTIINKPAVVVFWSDNTKTMAKCMEGDKFDPETGFAMAISKKYYELLGCSNSRAAFKKQLKEAVDQTEKTIEKKAKKVKK